MQKRTSQLTWGQGTHSLSLSVNRQRALRASVIKSLLNVTALEAEYAIHLSALRLGIIRIYSSPEDIVAHLPHNAIDGPYQGIAQLPAHPIFQHVSEIPCRSIHTKKGNMNSGKISRNIIGSFSAEIVDIISVVLL